jgi:hypothetical protein
MARRTGRRDSGGARFPTWWPTAVLGQHATGDGPVRAVLTGFTARAPNGRERERERERENDRGFERG